MIALIGTLYFVVVAAIGVWATKRTKTANDFFVAGSGIGLMALGISAMAATLSGFAFIGGPGLVYSMGFGALFIVLPAGLTNTMTAWALARKLRTLRSAADTDPQAKKEFIDFQFALQDAQEALKSNADMAREYMTEKPSEGREKK